MYTLFPKWEHIHVIAQSSLKKAWKKYGRDAETGLRAWYQEASAASWTCFNDINERYKSADQYGLETVIFNICGNKYRLIVNVSYAAQKILIEFFGTHAEYNKRDINEFVHQKK